jgi:hypothetical protein
MREPVCVPAHVQGLAGRIRVRRLIRSHNRQRPRERVAATSPRRSLRRHQCLRRRAVRQGAGRQPAARLSGHPHRRREWSQRDHPKPKPQAASPNRWCTVSYTLNAAATARSSFHQRLPGREERHGNPAHCLAPTHSERHDPGRARGVEAGSQAAPDYTPHSVLLDGCRSSSGCQHQPERKGGDMRRTHRTIDKRVPAAREQAIIRYVYGKRG